MTVPLGMRAVTLGNDNDLQCPLADADGWLWSADAGVRHQVSRALASGAARLLWRRSGSAAKQVEGAAGPACVQAHGVVFAAGGPI